MLYSCEFFRVGNDTNSLNTLCLHFNGQDEQGLVISADVVISVKSEQVLRRRVSNQREA
jgi:hypothetical protein